jgi:nucleotide-binding universal stress UspA family protein
MLKTLLVPLDGSVTSELALPFAEGVARAAHAKLILLRAVPHQGPGVFRTDPLSESLATNAENELRDAANRLAAGGLEVEQRIRPGDAGPVIMRAAEELHADLIVMSTHGRGGLGRAMYGSVADEVLRTTSVPVLFVPPRAQYRNPPRNIVVPLDGSPLAEAALEPAIDLAQAFRGKLVLVRVAAPPTYWVLRGESTERTPDPNSEAERAREYLDAVAERYATKETALSGFVTDGAAAEVVLEAAREHRAGAIAMATHGRTGLARVVMGSVAQQVLHSSDVPVLLVHPVGLADVEYQEPRLAGLA